MRAGGLLIIVLAIAALLHSRRKPLEDARDERTYGDWPNTPSFIRGNSQGRTVTAAQMLIQRKSVNGVLRAAQWAGHEAPMGGNVTQIHSAEIRRD